MPIRHVDWNAVFVRVVGEVESHYGLKLFIDATTIREVGERAGLSLESLNMDSVPNVAKVAGHVAFWIRKLKPVSFAPDSPNHLTVVNELVSLLVGVAICRTYFDDRSKGSFDIPPRILFDWVGSMRFNSHSPQSTAISFELMASL